MEYFGDTLNRKQLELRALKIDPMHRTNEAALISSRWFDYAPLLPAQATCLFAHHYKAQVKRWCEAHVDIHSAKDARAFTPDDIFMSRDMTAMWLARQVPDALGIPYDFSLRFANERALNRLFSRFPRPNQLYGEEFELDLRDAWKAYLAYTLRFSNLPQFKASAFTGSINQRRHLAFVLEQVASRPLPHHNLLGRMFNENVLSPQLVANTFDSRVIAQATEVAAMLASQS